MNFDTGSTGFMLVATSLVMLMTPGLAFFYVGLVGRKNVIAIMMQSFVSLAVTTALWFCVGYSLCLSGEVGGIIGNLDNAFLQGISIHDVLAEDNNIPLLVFVAYQMMFAIITPALITGAFTNRIHFPAYLIFLVAWLLLVYFPLAHMVWGVHGIGGTPGIIMLGVLGSTAVNPGGADGLIHGGGSFFIKQTVTVIGVSLYAFVFSYVMLKIINGITPVVVTKDEQETGVDEALHGEAAYL